MSDFLDRIANLSPKRLALLALEQHDELETVRKAQTEPIAIVGIGCRFPGGADSPESFWRLLHDGVDTITEVPADRWDIARYYDSDPDAPGRMYSKYGAFLDRVDRFDAHFFGIAPREAALMDPQQRLLLEVAWEALEHAGQAPGGMAGSATGVFVGVCVYDFSLLQLGDPNRIEAYSTSGAAPSILANRVSYVLDLQGPSLTVDTACSSSLVTVHLACQSLRRKECDAALAGGINLMLSPVASIGLSKGRMLAADGRCKTFDAGADGYVRGEGCGIVVLKRLSDALANHDSIHGVIRGSAVNQDGYGNGLTAPNLLAQQAVIRRALADAQVSPEQIGYIEAHGTGTALGDPIEVEALRATYGHSKSAVAIGSVKTNIGHLEGAAGIAGLIKVALALQHEAIPPHLHFKQLNPHISLDGTPFVIPARLRAWACGDTPRFGAVSSFGFGGTNAHVVLSQAPKPATAVAKMERPMHLLTLSAKSGVALDNLVRKYIQVLDVAQALVPAASALLPTLRCRTDVETSLDTAGTSACATSTASSWPDVCFTANAGRSHFAERLAVVADSAAGALSKLASAQGVRRGSVKGARVPMVAFLFTGQGAQYVGMGRQLYHTQPVFRAALDRCEKLLQPYLEQSLLTVLYPEVNQEVNRPSPLDETGYTQPALFAFEYALAELWSAWGVKPGAVLGHSVGEYTAACIAGVFGLEDALKLVATRARLMQALPPEGAMAAVFAGEREVAQAIGPQAGSQPGAVEIAALNGPAETVLSGARAALHSVVERLRAAGIKTRPLSVSHAFHSSLMEPILDKLESAAANIALVEPRLGLISNLTGRAVERGDLTQARYWRRHARQPVRFAAGIQALYAQGYRCFIEIGPQPVLLGSGRQCVPDENAVWLPSLRRGQDEWQQLLTSLGTFYTHGGNVDWRGFDSPYSRRRVPLPTYPFERQQYPVTRPEARSVSTSPSHPLLGRRLRSASRDIQFEIELNARPDDRAMILAAAQQVYGEGSFALEDVTVSEALEQQSSETVQTVLTPAGATLAFVRIMGCAADAGAENPEWRLHASGTVRVISRGTARLYEIQWQPLELGVRQESGADLLVRSRPPGRLQRDEDVPRGPGGPPHFLVAQSAERHPGSWLILADRSGTGLALAELLQARGESCTLVFPEEDFHRLLTPEAVWRGVVHLWGLDTEGADMLAGALRTCSSALRLVQALEAVEATLKPRLWLVSRGAQPMHAPLWGLGSVIALEHPELKCSRVDLDADDLAPLANELMAGDREDQIRWRAGLRYVARLVPSTTLASPEMVISPGHTYLVTGGLGALGIEAARWLVAEGARHLVLLGRRTPSTKAREAIEMLQESGADVTILQANVAEAAEMAQVFDSLKRTHPPLRGIIHAAGVLDDGVLLHQTEERFSEVLAPKVAGAWNLHTLTRDLPLDFLVFFSSMASLLGSAGQGNYTAANAFLDALAHYRRAQGLPALSVNWGPWATAGMAASQDDRQQRRRAAQGIHEIPPGQAFEILARLLPQPAAQIGVLDVEWPRFLEQFDDNVPPLLDGLSPPNPLPRAQPNLRQRLEKTPSAQRQAFLSGHVREQAIKVLGLEAEYPLDPEKPLKELGLDSLMAVELAKALGAGIERPLPATVVFTHPTVADLAAYLLAELFPQQLSPQPDGMEEVKRAQWLDEVRQLSESELEAFVYQDSSNPAGRA